MDKLIIQAIIVIIRLLLALVRRTGIEDTEVKKIRRDAENILIQLKTQRDCD